MKRRDFLNKSLATGLFAGALMKVKGSVADNSLAGETNYKAPFDLVAVMNGEPDVMFDKAIASLGGMSKFVKAGQKVVVKPNIGWDCTPERGANTNPILVKSIVEHCIKAGAKEVLVFDFTCDNWQKCYQNSGIENAVKEAGGKMIPGNSESYYKPITIKQGKRLKEAKEHEMIINADVFINVPVLKHHSGPGLSIAMKNLMGIVWDRGFWHKNDLDQCIADYATYRKPTLNVVDAYRVMKKNGPKGVSANDVVLMKSLLVSTDIVAIDAAAAKMFGKDPKDVAYIKLAADMGVGRMDLDKLNINRIKV